MVLSRVISACLEGTKYKTLDFLSDVEIFIAAMFRAVQVFPVPDQCMIKKSEFSYLSIDQQQPLSAVCEVLTQSCTLVGDHPMSFLSFLDELLHPSLLLIEPVQAVARPYFPWRQEPLEKWMSVCSLQGVKHCKFSREGHLHGVEPGLDNLMPCLESLQHVVLRVSDSEIHGRQCQSFGTLLSKRHCEE
ncbi:hypothetical protein FGO68_gene14248 [Halteria grandinella]|uniref:Uncharacterized protein n=1 Tax=Halteria grandinella TaxID=5974 RepID=A0A8J8T6Y6_HALGN|nr:hypothetical protein FGO68_gene14248 [Halteria grandinella]